MWISSIMTNGKQWYRKATTYAVYTKIKLPLSNLTVDSLFYSYLPCFHRHWLDWRLYHGYIKMVIISRRSLSHFRDVKNIFLRCSRIKVVTRGNRRFRAVPDKLSKFHSAVLPGVKFPHHCKSVDVRKEEWWYLFLIDILLSKHKPTKYC